MTTPPPCAASPRVVELLKAWRQREQQLLEGAVIPTFQDREHGHSPFRGSALLDLRQMLDMEIDRDQQPAGVIEALKHCHAVPTAKAVYAAYEATMDDADELSGSLLWHAAIRGHDDACRQLCVDMLGEPGRHGSVGWLHGAAFALGLMHLYSGMSLEDEGLDASEVAECRDKGLGRLRRLGDQVIDHNLAEAALDRPEQKPAETGMQSALAAMKAANAAVDADFEEHLTAVLEDRAEIKRDPTLLVIDADPNQKQTGARADIWKAYKSVIGTRLSLVSTAAVPAARTTLHARYPHMHVEIDAILATQAALQSVKLAVLLIGEPGSGKTTFARELAELLGVPAMTYSCAGASDGAFGGTSAQWNSARPATPMQMVGRSKRANPLIVLDETDKIGTSRHNGSLADTLLTFLEPVSSRVFYDLALELPVDLSAVSYVATANVLEDVPAALKDRFKIVRIPSPGFEHIGTLSQRIIDDLAQQRGLDRRWLDPLAQDETELVRKAWPGGSLRMLTRIVTTIVDGRDSQMGRA